MRLGRPEAFPVLSEHVTGSAAVEWLLIVLPSAWHKPGWVSFRPILAGRPFNVAVTRLTTSVAS